MSVERLLWSAVLVQAVRDLHGPDPDEARAARHFLKSGDAEVVAELCGFDRDAFRDRVPRLFATDYVMPNTARPRHAGSGGRGHRSG